MKLFGKKSTMEKLGTTLAQLQLRAAALADKRAIADAALAAATAARQSHRLEGDLADEKLDAKLQNDVDLCLSKLTGLDADIATLQAKVTETEQQLAAERNAAQRKTAAEKLAHDLDLVEKTLPNCLEAGRRFVSALEELHHNFEATQMATFLASALSQVEIAAAFTLTELRGTVRGIADGTMLIPAAKPVSVPVTTVEPTGTRRLFAMRPIKWKDAEGRQQYGQQFEDHDLTPAAAANGQRCGAVEALHDPRRKELRGARGGHHVNKNAIDLLDLDSEEACRPPHIQPVLRSEPVAAANITVLDCGPAIMGTISVARV
jgi:hypothetical protein